MRTKRKISQADLSWVNSLVTTAFGTVTKACLKDNASLYPLLACLASDNIFNGFWDAYASNGYVFYRKNWTFT